MVDQRGIVQFVTLRDLFKHRPQLLPKGVRGAWFVKAIDGHSVMSVLEVSEQEEHRPIDLPKHSAIDQVLNVQTLKARVVAGQQPTNGTVKASTLVGATGTILRHTRHALLKELGGNIVKN